jgi:transposase
LLIGYFEGLDSERGIAWRASDSLALRDFLGLALHEAPPDHSNDFADASAHRSRDA